MDLLYLLKENFKILLSDLSIWRILSNVLRDIESDLAYTKASEVASQYILWSGSLWYPVRNSMLKIKPISSLVISKLTPAFWSVQLGTFRNNRTYPGIILAYSGIFRTQCYPDIFKTVVCPERWYIQNQKHIHNSGTFRTPLYSERWHIQNLRHIQNLVLHLLWNVNYFQGYNYFLKL